MFWYVFICAFAYLLGSVNLSIILAKKLKGIDIRQHGSGNAGTTNTLRVLGKGPAAIVLLFDIFKGAMAVGIAYLITLTGTIPDTDMLIQLAGLCAILGHNFPVYYGFKGGKGVATSLGTICVLNPQIGLICLVFGIIIIAITRWVSLGSMLAAVLYPILCIVLAPKYFVFAVILSLLLIYRHRENIKRILNGTERKLGQKAS